MITKHQILRVHKMCGLAACVLILIQAITGASNVYRHDVAQFVDPKGMVRQSADIDAPFGSVLRSLQNAHPDFGVERVIFPTLPNGTYFAHLLTRSGETHYASIDPGSTEILRSGTLWAFPANAAARVHYNLTIGLPGIALVAVTGLLCLVMALTGIIYWWPRPGRRLSPLAMNWRAPRELILRQLHRNTGVTMSLLVSFSLVTGVVLAVNYVYNDFSSAIKPLVGLPANAQPEIDRAIRQARSTYPDRVIRDIRFVGDTQTSIFFYAPERSPRAVHQVTVDLESGEVATTVDAQSNTALWVTWLPLHTGESLGAFGLVLVTANALALLLLVLSGPTMWYIRVTLRRRKKPYRNDRK